MATTRYALEQALADYHLSGSNDDGNKSRTYSTAEILAPSHTGSARGDSRELSRQSSVKSASNKKEAAPVRPRALLRRSSSLDTFQGKPGRLRLSEKERVEALKRDAVKTRSNYERRSVDLPRPILGNEDVVDHYVKKSRVEELNYDEIFESRDSKSLDIPRPGSESPNRQENTGRPKYDSVAAEFGLGPLAEEDANEYSIWNASITNLRVCPVKLDGGLFFYIATRSFIPNRPGVTIHAGSDKAGRILGVAHLDYFSTTNLMGVGDTAGNPTGVMWYKLHRNHGTVVEFLTHVKYTFEVVNDETGDTRKFGWYRTKNLPVLDDQGDLILVEEGDTDVLAEYKGHGPLGQVSKQRGALKIKKMEALGKDWEMVVMLSWASILELSRRRARMRRSSILRAGIF